MRIEVTQEHINKADKKIDGGKCPLARAFAEKLGYEMHVSYSGIYQLVNDKFEFLFEHTKVSNKFISDFDKRKKVKPHTFSFKRL